MLRYFDFMLRYFDLNICLHHFTVIKYSIDIKQKIKIKELLKILGRLILFINFTKKII